MRNLKEIEVAIQYSYCLFEVYEIIISKYLGSYLPTQNLRRSKKDRVPILKITITLRMIYA